jgi:predicted DNA-binding transcriptional regulator YafY
MPRKKLPKTALPRIYFIDQEIALGKFPNAPALAEKYETSVSSINRDIAYMRDMLNAPIEYDFYKKGFYYTKKTFRLAAAYAGADDILALAMAKNLMDLYRDTPIHDAALNLLESISVPLQDSQKSEWFKDRIVIPKTSTVPVDSKVWHCIVSALKENRVIAFEYLGQQKELKTRRVRPYQLLFDQHAWYLSGYDEDRKENRIFHLSRISKIALTEQSFAMGANFDYRTFEGVSYFGVYAKAQTHKFIIDISGDTRFVNERQFADDQYIQETAKGVRLSFTSNQFGRILSWLLSHGASVRPVAPKQLVESWKKAIKEMAELI